MKICSEQKCIWIINEYAGSPEHGLHFRHYSLAREFIRHGYNVVIISASYSHLLRNPPRTRGWFTKEIIDGISYIWVKVPSYDRSHSPVRLLKWLVFSASLFFLPRLPRPQAIIVAPTATYPILPAYFLSRKNHCRFIVEIKDVWPQTIMELANVSKFHPLIVSMAWMEKFGIEKACKVTSNLPNYGNYLREKGMDTDFEYIPNGVDFHEISENEPLRPSVEKLLPSTGFIIGYAGTLGCANALDYLIGAASQITNPDIHFVIVGKGQEKKRLERLAAGLKNVSFLPNIPKKQVPSLLARFDVCYIGWNVLNIYNYGVAANKIFEYMYAEKPVLHSYSNGFDLIKEAECGITVEAENPNAIAEGILRLYEFPEKKRREMGRNGKKFVMENHSYEKLANKYIKIFE
ncbi:glycosyltransferase family 4 protein [Desulfobotulus sp. H1]|uniref:Glycosyltransferase family 4 protein n=1 Tax=Desulfobotulus pelophilus TaxID=2823377 RepID=A0ABT3NCY0_9BACT|nr:glycosyltransferase family 4 protein [Desulfobotulus pelophilus]MCW7755323.1 glycosyltransferase family 4 protein [Desulfobotulus pelophilus]